MRILSLTSTLEPEITAPDRPLITFDAPPVSEVALALQFERPVIDLEVLGLFAGRLKGEYPVQQQQPPVPPMEESVGPVAPSIQVQFAPAVGLPRTWLTSVDGHELVQVQSDRVVVNWRRLGGGKEYPRYQFMRQWLSRVVHQLGEILQTTDAPAVHVNFCELAYVNEVALEGAQPGGHHADLSELVAVLSPLRGDFLPPAEDAQFQARWRIPSDQLPPDSPIGRVYFVVQPGYRADSNLPIYAVHLTSRIVPPPATTMASALELLDVGHAWNVRAFAELTTERMHELWRLREA